MFSSNLHRWKTVVMKSGQHVTRLESNYTLLESKKLILSETKFSYVNTQSSKIWCMPSSSSECKQFLRSNSKRYYSDSKVNRVSQNIHNLRSRFNNLFVFGDWRMEDMYAIYLMAFFGGIGIFIFSVDLKGGFTENFDEVKSFAKNDSGKN